MPDGRQPVPGGWNRIQLVVEDIDAQVKRLRAEGLTFRNEIVKGAWWPSNPVGRPVTKFGRIVSTGGDLALPGSQSLLGLLPRSGFHKPPKGYPRPDDFYDTERPGA